MIPQEVSWNSAVYKAYLLYKVISNCFQTQCMLAGMYSPGCCSVHLLWTHLPNTAPVKPKLKQEVFWNSFFQWLNWGIDVLMQKVWGETSQGIKKSALCINLCISSSLSTCNASRQNTSLAARLSQQFLGEPFLTANNVLDTHGYTKCSGYTQHT